MDGQPTQGLVSPVFPLAAERIGVALSGGGHRAALFALGALTYLVDARANERVVSVASVSGGSIANGMAADKVDFRQTSPLQFRDEVVKPLAGRIAGDGILFADPLTKAFIVVTALLGISFGVLAGPWALPLCPWLRLGLAVAFLVALTWLLRYRGHLHDHALGSLLFRRADGTRKRLDESAASLDHVFCATDLEGQHQVFFLRDSVWSYDHGHGAPGNLALATAVQASAAFPGAFPPRVLRSAPFAFQRGRVDSRHMVLADGGVYDNMADQWAAGYGTLRDHEDACVLPSEAPRVTRPDRHANCMLVINASARPRWLPLSSRWVPVLSEVRALARVILVMFGQSTTTRRAELRDRFTGHTGTVFPGVFVSIDRSPGALAEAFLACSDARADRARAVLRCLGIPRDPQAKAQYEAEAEANRDAPTSLSSFGAAQAARLLWHGYVSTMCNAHVVLGFPLFVPPRQASSGAEVFSLPLPVPVEDAEHNLVPLHESVGNLAMAWTAAQIRDTCEARYPANTGDCNAFARAVSVDLGVAIPGGLDADGIVAYVRDAANGYSPLGDGLAAKAAADQGQFVLGGLKGADHVPPRDHGHLVVVVSGPLDPAHGKYPLAYWGSLGGTPGRAQHVNYAWNAGDRDSVEYFGRPS